MKRRSVRRRWPRVLVCCVLGAGVGACDEPPSSPPAAPASPLLGEFSDEALRARSDLSLRVHAGEGADARLRTIALRCSDGETLAVFKDASELDERRREAPASEAGYLGAWESLRSSGLLGGLMAGRAPPPGTDVYLSGHVGAAGLGFTVSVSAETARTHAGIAAFVRAMETLDKP